METWGDLFYVGLTGIEIFSKLCNIINKLDEKDEKIQVDKKWISASPSDLNSIPGHNGDYRTVDKLVDNYNITTDDRHMWLIPFSSGLSHTITIKFPKVFYIKRIKIFNYNKSLEDTFRGAKLITITVDKNVVTAGKGICIRKAPGNDSFDFGQVISFPFQKGYESERIIEKAPDISGSLQSYETPYCPTGYLFEFILYSTHGDVHYIGLNGIEMYDIFGKPLLQNGQQGYKLVAIPFSVNELEGMKEDIRTPEKLVDGENETLDDRHMWLAPYMNTRLFAVTNRTVAKTPNKIIVAFNNPLAISGIKMWNYTKQPNRGVDEIAIHRRH